MLWHCAIYSRAVYCGSSCPERQDCSGMSYLWSSAKTSNSIGALLDTGKYSGAGQSISDTAAARSCGLAGAIACDGQVSSTLCYDGMFKLRIRRNVQHSRVRYRRNSGRAPGGEPIELTWRLPKYLRNRAPRRQQLIRAERCVQFMGNAGQ